MKKRVALCFICTMLYTTSIFAKDITVTYNNIPISYTQNPVVKNGTTFVPMKQTLETLGVTVSWNAPTKTVIGRKDNTIVSTCPNSKTLIVSNGDKSQKITMDAAAYIENGTLFVPLRAVLQPFQASIIWDSETNTAQIKTADNPFSDVITEKTESKSIQNSNGVTVWQANLSYPELKGDSEAITKINQTIANDVQTALSAVQNELSPDDINTDLDNMLPYTFDCSYNITYLDDNTISLLLDYYEFTGGAHGTPFRQAYTFDLNTAEQLQLSDILNIENADDFAKDAFKNNIAQNPESYFNGAAQTVDSEQFAYDFYIQPNEIILFTQAYLLEPYANHFQPTTITIAEIQNRLKRNIKTA